VFISGSKTIIGTTSITGSLLVTGSLNTVGTITATTLVVQTITSSISSITGSTNFGSLSSNTHTFTGSINASGSGNFSGSLTVGGFGTSNFSSAGTGYNKVVIRNTTAGVANGAQLSIGTDADPDQLYIQSFATTFTTSGMNVAGGAVVNGEGPGGLNLAATQASIGFYTNGAAAANLRMNISSDGTIQQYAGTNQATGGAYNTFGNLYVASTTAQGIDIGGSISIGGKYNNAGAYATFARIQGKKENGSTGQTGGYLAFEVCTDATNLNTERMRIKSNGSISIIGPSATNPTNLSLTCITSTGNNDTLRISTSLENSGKVSIETLSGSGNRAVYSDSTGLLTNSSSDVTLKTNVENITYGLNSVISLRPVFYNWIPENLGPQKEIGFIAQEVQAIIPEVIGINNDDTLSLDYPKLTAVLVKAIQELTARVQYLENK
jgi:hypothetical protein